MHLLTMETFLPKHASPCSHCRERLQFVVYVYCMARNSGTAVVDTSRWSWYACAIALSYTLQLQQCMAATWSAPARSRLST